MKSSLRTVLAALRVDGFAVERVTHNKHLKIYLERAGTRFFITVSGSPASDSTDKVRKDARHTWEKRRATHHTAAA